MKVAVLSWSGAFHAEVHRRSIEAGFTVVPLSARAPPAVMEADLARTEAQVLVTDLPGATATLPVPVVTDLDRLDASGDGTVRALVQTSGTTGDPRWVALTRSMLDAHRVAASKRLESGPDSVWLAVLPPWHVGGVALIDRHVHDGSELRTVSRFDGAQVAAALPGTTHVSLVPLMLRRLLDAKVLPPPSLRCALVGGDRLDPLTAREALGSGWPLYPTYGMTEACSQVATATPEEARRDPACVGRPLDGVLVRIVDPDEEGWGRIEVGGPTVAGGHVRSDDVGQLDRSGRLHVQGRVLERIVSGGETVDARAVEAVLESHPGVLDSCVVGVPDPEWGQRVAAAVSGTASVEDLTSWCKQRLDAAQRPRRYLLVGSIPRTDAGKLRRQAVLDLFQSTKPA